MFAVIWGGYLVLDLVAGNFTAGVTANLTAKEGFTAATFPIAALYIAFVNSMLEEFFFRGFFHSVRRFLKYAPVLASKLTHTSLISLGKRLMALPASKFRSSL